MAWRSSGATNRDLIENLWNNKLIKDARVKEAFLKVDRAHYAPSHPYDDRPQSIGYGATISAPHMHACAVESLLPYILPTASNPAPRVLDIGSGSGYLTHVFAELVGDSGTVVGVEHIPQLAALGERNMAKSAEGREFLRTGRVKFRVGDGRKGWVETEGEVREGEEEAVERRGMGWDAIHVGASAVEMHDELVRQLRAPARMFIPVDDDESRIEQHIWTVDKDGGGRVERKRLFGVRKPTYITVLSSLGQCFSPG
ncbi:protein-L-isoaspartate O-methyltransferase [Coniochaeta sp. 2T2.1]|nr:protein-L-isoaspartate O-methyltransferase [Coniochaeta sp. 2T2.1]